MNKKLILITVVFLIAIFIIYQIFIKEDKLNFELAEASFDTVVEEISETGQVQMGELINLGFKTTGIIQNIYVKIGDEVSPGTSLVRIDTTQLIAERNESEAALEVAKAKLNQLLSGSTPQQIQAAQTDLANAQTALADAELDFEENLKQAYQDAQNVLDNSYLKASGALITISLIRKTYFYYSDQESIAVQARENNISSLANLIKNYVDGVQADVNNRSYLDEALSATEAFLNQIYNDLNVIREATEKSNYTDIVSSANKTLLNTERTNINTALTNAVNTQQTIASTKITGQTAVNTARGSLKTAQDDLNLLLAEPSEADLSLYQAQVKQVQAQVNILNNKIWEATLRSPIQGQITKINKKVGETASDSVITLLPQEPFEIEVDIYEEDIVKMKIGNEVIVSLIAFPDKTFSGKVISINPAEELIENVVYYTVKISFEAAPEGTKPGMTADLMIRTDSRENVLVVPDNAVSTKNDKYTVQVFKDNKIQEREITIGLIGSNDLIEVISGVQEGEQVIID